MRTHLTTLLTLAPLLGVPAFGATSADNPFVHPPELAPDIRFWTRVYTEIDTHSGYLHDDRHLGVVYATLQFSRYSSKRKRRAQIDAAKSRYREILISLAARGNNDLDPEQQAVRALWPEDMSAEQLRAAAERLRFQLGQRDRFLGGLRRAGAWDAYIRGVLREHGLPQALAALPHVESSYYPLALSHRGASGLWQFTKATGRRYLRIDRAVDERRDPFLASDAAARLLRHNLAATGSWPLAITAYNHGTSGVRRAALELKTTDIVPILRRYQSRRFGFASRNFYVAFLAAAQIAGDAERYFGQFERDPSRTPRTLVMDAYVAADAVADKLNVDVAVLRELNPALKATVWKGVQLIPAGYDLHLPAGWSPAAASRRLAGLASYERHAEQLIEREYVVESGNTLSTIAQQFRVSLSDLIAINDLRNRHFIRTGQLLRLPLPLAGSGSQQPGEGFYKVASGDSLSVIAQKFGLSQRKLIELNALTDADLIVTGQSLRVADTSSAALAPVTDSAGTPRAMQASELAMLETSELSAQTPAQMLDQQSALAADPSDYSVGDDGTIEAHFPETLGHYANWLELPTQRLRDANERRKGQPVITGQRLRLVFAGIGPLEFEQRRREFHAALQERYFSRHQITGTREHVIRRGDSLWLLAQFTFRVPLWLLHQYNPDVDLARVRPGTRIVIPKLRALPAPVPADNRAEQERVPGQS